MTDNPAADQKQRFLFPDSDIRGELVRLDRSLAEVLGAHDYPMAVQGLVGEAVAAVALLTGTLKFEGRLSLQAQGRGPVSLLLAECTHDGQLRALARHDERAADCPPTVAGLIGDGTMVITITPDRGRQYQGIVPWKATPWRAAWRAISSSPSSCPRGCGWPPATAGRRACCCSACRTAPPAPSTTPNTGNTWKPWPTP